MACKQRDFRKDKPKPLRVRIACSVYPVRNSITRNNIIGSKKGQISNGVKILTIFRKGE